MNFGQIMSLDYRLIKFAFNSSPVRILILSVIRGEMCEALELHILYATE